MTTPDASGTSIRRPSNRGPAAAEDEAERRRKNQAAIRVLEEIHKRPSTELQDEWPRFKVVIDAERAEGQKLYP